MKIFLHIPTALLIATVLLVAVSVGEEWRNTNDAVVWPLILIIGGGATALAYMWDGTFDDPLRR